VIGTPSERWGEAVTAIVVRSDGSDLDADGLIAASRSQLASYKKPTRVEFVDELPRNAGMKVQKHILREQFGVGE